MPGVSSVAAGVISGGLKSSIPSAAGAFSSFMPAIGAGLDAAGGFLGGLFNANQARKNRQFQERMYNKQVEDNIRFWEMQNRYNLPSAMKQRLEDAGLNSLLMYGSGGQSMVAASPVQAAQAPNGSQASMSAHTNFGQALAQSALLQAQIRNINADSEQKETAAKVNEQSAQNVEQDVLLKRLTKDINVAIRYRDYDFLNASIDRMYNQTFNESQLRLQNVLTLMQGREYQIKHYELSKWYQGQTIRIGLANVENGRIQASAAMKSASAAWQHAINEANLNNAQIGEINQRIFQSRKVFPELYKQAKWNTNQKQMDFFMNFLLGSADLTQKQVDIVKSKLQTVRIGLGNDSGLGSVLAPFQMPVGLGSSNVDEQFNNLLKTP